MVSGSSNENIQSIRVELRQAFAVFPVSFLLCCCVSLSFAANRFDPQLSPIGSIAPLEANDKQISNSTRIYRTWFDNSSWQGDLIEYYIDRNGELKTAVKFDGATPSSSNNNRGWSAQEQMSNKGSSWWNTGRKVIFLSEHDGVRAQKAFRYGHLNADQKTKLSRKVLNFVRGKRSEELQFGGDLRNRVSLMGDIIHRNPVHVGPPSEWILEQSYLDFQDTHKRRTAEILVGSNGGMLHVIDADTGNERYAYVPSMVIDNLYKLAAPDYIHTYFVDGGITVRDAHIGSWATVAVGSLGAGGKGVFALDVTHPNIRTERSSSGRNKKILWEYDARSDNDLGYIYGRPGIVRLMESDGETSNYYAVFGNGYNSQSGKAALYIVDLKTGQLKKKIVADTGSASSPNGLSAPALVDHNGDGVIDYAYAGTIDGQLFKFELGHGPGDWKLVGELFETFGGADRPITTQPQVTRHPSGDGFLIIVGTGRLFETSDIGSTTSQRVYGIWDLNEGTFSKINRGDLLWQRIDRREIQESGKSFLVVSHNTIDWSIHKGWQVSLYGINPGARVIVDPDVRTGRVKFTVTRPRVDKLARNWDAELHYETGGGDDSPIVDKDENGVIDDRDKVRGGRVPMIVGRPTGLRSAPTALRYMGNVDVLMHNALQPAQMSDIDPDVLVQLNGDAGLIGGHFDMETYLNGSSGYRKGWTSDIHGYDINFGTTTIDYLNAQGSIESFNPRSGERYIVVLANADLSPGAVIKIGRKSWNSLEYQTMIHRKLLNWNGNPSRLRDDDGDSLIFTRSDLTCSGCGFSQYIPPDVIGSGGLMPTDVYCVFNEGDWERRNGRRRDGAMLTYVIELENWSNPLRTNKLEEQQPGDLPNRVLISHNNQVKQINLTRASNGIQNFGGLHPKSSDVYAYGATNFWHYRGACYEDYDQWKEDRAEAINQQFNCTSGESGPNCRRDISGNVELDTLLSQLQNQGILAANFTTGLTSAWAYCEDASNQSDSKYNETCVGTNSVLNQLEILGAGNIVDGTGGGSGGGTTTAIRVNGKLSPVTKTKVDKYPQGRKSWMMN